MNKTLRQISIDRLINRKSEDHHAKQGLISLGVFFHEIGFSGSADSFNTVNGQKALEMKLAEAEFNFGVH